MLARMPDGSVPAAGFNDAPVYGVPGGQMPGMGYDQYIPMIRERMRRRPMPGLRLPKAPPRFPTPGRMDGTRDYPTKGPSRTPLMGLGGM